MAKLSKSQIRLAELEKELRGRGVRLGYERLEYAGLRLKSGLCWFKGQYYLFVDRLKTVPERLELIEGALEELDGLAAQGRLADPLGQGPEPQAPGPEDQSGPDQAEAGLERS